MFLFLGFLSITEVRVTLDSEYCGGDGSLMIEGRRWWWQSNDESDRLVCQSRF